MTEMSMEQRRKLEIMQRQILMDDARKKMRAKYEYHRDEAKKRTAHRVKATTRWAFAPVKKKKTKPKRNVQHGSYINRWI